MFNEKYVIYTKDNKKYMKFCGTFEKIEEENIYKYIEYIDVEFLLEEILNRYVSYRKIFETAIQNSIYISVKDMEILSNTYFNGKEGTYLNPNELTLNTPDGNYCCFIRDIWKCNYLSE